MFSKEDMCPVCGKGIYYKGDPLYSYYSCGHRSKCPLSFASPQKNERKEPKSFSIDFPEGEKAVGHWH
jgi:hypothetical protein